MATLNTEYFKKLDLTKLTGKIQRVFWKMKKNLSIQKVFHQKPTGSYPGDLYGISTVYKITLNDSFDYLLTV